MSDTTLPAPPSIAWLENAMRGERNSEVIISLYEAETILSTLRKFAQMERDARRKLTEQLKPGDISDPTFDIRRKQANLAEAVMVRVFDLEAQAAALTEIAKKLRAAVMANT